MADINVTDSVLDREETVANSQEKLVQAIADEIDARRKRRRRDVWKLVMRIANVAWAIITTFAGLATITALHPPWGS